MNELIYYSGYSMFMDNKNTHKLNEIPGGLNYKKMFGLVGGNFTFYDRTGAINIPLNVSALPQCAIPKYDATFTKEFSQITDERAVFLMEQAKRANRKIAVMYSGGVDSTLVLTAFFKNCPNDVRDNLVVLMNDNSIAENPNFFYNHIIKLVDNIVPSFKYTQYVGNDNFLTTSGELADQLFVTSFGMTYGREYGLDALNADLESQTGNLISYFNTRIKTNMKDAENVFLTLSKTIDTCPYEIETPKDYFWWWSFCTMWHSNYVRVLPFCSNPKGIKFEENYTTFFCNKEYQLWSMNNRNNVYKGGTTGYKFIPKQYIFEYTGDSEYNNKQKIGSLGSAIQRKIPWTYIDKEMSSSYEFPPKEFYNYDNDFINW